VERAISEGIADELRQAEAAVEESVMLRKRQLAAARKAELEVYYAQVAENEAHLAGVRAAMAEAGRERRLAHAEVAAERIGYRMDLLQQRADKVKQLEAEAAALEAERSALLERLISSVPYAEKIASIAEAPSGDRVTAPTASYQASADLGRAYAAYLKAVHGYADTSTLEDGSVGLQVPGTTTHGSLDFALAASKVTGTGKNTLLQLANTRLKEQGLFGRQGFTDKQVTGDKRWRFVSALRAAGVGAHEGTAARQALSVLNTGVRGSHTAAIITQGGSGLA
jgi:hypothetical protein